MARTADPASSGGLARGGRGLLDPAEGLAPRAGHHLFDGDGMLQAVRLRGGPARCVRERGEGSGEREKGVRRGREGCGEEEGAEAELRDRGRKRGDAGRTIPDNTEVESSVLREGVRWYAEFYSVLVRVSNADSWNIQTAGIGCPQYQFRISSFNAYIQTGPKRFWVQAP